MPEDEPEMPEEDDLSDDIPEDVPGDEPEMPEENDLSDDIPEDVPEDEPEMTEENDLSDDIPEDIPEEQAETEDTITDAEEIDSTESTEDTQDKPSDDTSTEDTATDVDSADSTEPTEDTQDEPLDDTTTDEVTDDTTSDVDNADSTEPTEDTQDEPLDDTATEDTADDAATDVDNTDSTEPTEDTQDEPLDDTTTHEATDDTTSDVDNTDSTEPTEDTQDVSLDDTTTEETAEDITSDVESVDSAEPTEDIRGEPMDDATTDETTENITSDVDDSNLDEQTDTQKETAEDTNEFNDGTQDDPSKVLKRDELDLLKSGNDAINQRLEAQADDYRDKGMSEDEIRDRLAADKWNFQKEFLEDAFPGQEVSPNVFNGLSENGAKDRLADIGESSSLREQLKSNEIDNELSNANPSNDWNEDEWGPNPFAETKDKKWDYDEWGPNPFADQKALSRGEIADHIFSDEDVADINNIENLRLEDLSKNDYEKIKQTDPQKASQLLTDYNDRNFMPDDLSSLPRHLSIENNDGLEIVDKDLVKDRATMRDMATGQEYSVYPNPMDRVSHMAGRQGQNDLGMHQDCGIASTAKSINDIYGKNVTSENRLADYAYDTGNCSIKRKPDGTVDIYNSGGTWEGNVKDFYNANGLEADMYVGNDVPSPELIAERLKNGEVATLAVNHDLMWSWDEAQAFNPDTIDDSRYMTDSRYAKRVDDLMKMKDGGTFKADHFVNVSNAVYDKKGSLTHFIVSDTGNGTTRMIDKDYLYRAYNGSGNINVSAQGCVIAGRR